MCGDAHGGHRDTLHGNQSVENENLKQLEHESGTKKTKIATRKKIYMARMCHMTLPPGCLHIFFF